MTPAVQGSAAPAMGSGALKISSSSQRMSMSMAHGLLTRSDGHQTSDDDKRVLKRIVMMMQMGAAGQHQHQHQQHGQHWTDEAAIGGIQYQASVGSVSVSRLSDALRRMSQQGITAASPSSLRPKKSVPTYRRGHGGMLSFRARKCDQVPEHSQQYDTKKSTNSSGSPVAAWPSAGASSSSIIRRFKEHGWESRHL